MNHMITTVLQVKNLDDCEYLCYLEDACVSLNIKNMDSDGTHECELNNSTHMEHGQDLVENPIYYYRGAKVIKQLQTFFPHLFKVQTQEGTYSC